MYYSGSVSDYVDPSVFNKLIELIDYIRGKLYKSDDDDYC